MKKLINFIKICFVILLLPILMPLFIINYKIVDKILIFIFGDLNEIL